MSHRHAQFAPRDGSLTGGARKAANLRLLVARAEQAAQEAREAGDTERAQQLTVLARHARASLGLPDPLDTVMRKPPRGKQETS